MSRDREPVELSREDFNLLGVFNAGQLKDREHLEKVANLLDNPRVIASGMNISSMPARFWEELSEYQRFVDPNIPPAAYARIFVLRQIDNAA